MSAISLKSITGITSITTPTGVDNQLTLHTNNTTEAVKLDSAGNLHFHNHLNITGVATATSFVGSGANLTSLPAQATIANNADNRVITGGSGVNLNGEENLTWNGNTLTVSATIPQVTFNDTNNENDFGIKNINGNFQIVDIDESNRIGFQMGSDGNTMLGGNTTMSGKIFLHETIEHIGDSNTKIKFPTDDNISFEVAGVEAARFLPTSAGSGGPRMGLGTNNPTGMLHIYGANPPFRIQNSNDSANLQMGMWDQNNIMLQASNRPFKLATETSHPIVFHTGGLNNERLRIDSSGNVMIGTTSSTVYDDTSGSGVVIRGATGAVDIMRDNDICLLLNRNTGDGQMLRLSRSGVSKADLSLRSNALCLDTANSERLRIDSDGRCIVGGGTHGGGSALVVKGGNQNTYSTIGMFSNHTNPAVNTLLTQIRFGSNTSAVGADIRAEADAAWGTNDYPTRLSFYTAPDGSNSRSERLRITKDGQIRIDQATSANNGIRMRPSGWNYDFRIGAVSSSGGSIWLGQNYEPTGGTRDSSGYGTNYIQFTTGGDIHFGTGATNTNPTERLRIDSTGSLRAFTSANGVSCFSNSEHGNVDFNHRGGRVLHSNGTGWDGNSSTDGSDPILVLAVENRAGNSDIGDAYGLCLHSESQDDNDFGPMIGWSSRSTSGSYNTTYAAIVGKKEGQGIDNNWSAGELQFYTMPTGGYIDNTPNIAIDSAGRVKSPRQVGFYATANSGGTVTMSSTHVLNNWRLSTSGKTYSIGGHFNTSNGRFTAPVSGQYLFTGSILLQNYDTASGIHMIWRKNGSNYQYWYNTRTSDIDRSGYGGYLAQGSTTTFSLVANDYIDVACDFSGTLKLWCGDANWGHFSGYFLG